MHVFLCNPVLMTMKCNDMSGFVVKVQPKKKLRSSSGSERERSLNQKNTVILKLIIKEKCRDRDMMWPKLGPL